MQIKRFEFSILLCLVIVVQIACLRFSREEASSNSNSPPLAEEVALVEKIFERYTEAVGGQEAIDRVTSYKTKGTFELAGRQGSIEIWGKDPNKNLTVMEFPVVGTIKKGFDGETQWVQTPAGTVSESSEQEIAEVERDAEIYRAGALPQKSEIAEKSGQYRNAVASGERIGLNILRIIVA